ncbi:MAG: glycosyltransferase family 2 protein [Cyclobacteriaceae bacterium]|nr:glycosyltransferase family 2 protein [Cyclobacteriaceae bacterium]
MKSVAVIILNFNGREHLERFLPSVTRYSTPHKIIVADNGSTDDSITYLKSNYPEVQLLKFKENHGFCGGYNRAIEEVEADYIILLNNDIEVTKNWIEPLIDKLDELDQSPTIFAVQPKVLSLRQPDSFEYAGAAGGYMDKLGYPFCRGRIFETLEKDLGQYDDNRKIFWATGACMAVRRDVYLELGGLDEDFFAHMEEIDLCWRAQHQGYSIEYCFESTIYHLGGGTLGYNNPTKTYYNFRNNLFMLIKNMPTTLLVPTLIVRLLFDFAAAVKFLLEGSRKSFISVVKAYGSVLISLPKLIKKRKKVHHKEWPSSVIYSGSIAFDYYIQNKKYFEKLKFQN